MGVIIDIEHEAGDLSEYDSTVTDGGDLSAHADAALAGTSYGLHCVIDDTNSIYGQVTQGDTGTGKLRVRFYIDPKSLTMGDGNMFDIFDIYTNGAPYYLLRLYLRRSGSDYQLRAVPYNDAGALASDTEVISDTEHYVEIYFQRASSDVAADGSVEWWIDGVSKQTWTSVDNWDVFVDIAIQRIGAVIGIDAGTSGTLYLDQLKENDDGSQIGAYSAVVPLTGTIAALSSVTGSAKVSRKLSGAVAALSSVAGSAKVSRKLSGDIAALSSITGSAKVSRKLSGAVAALSSVTGSIQLITAAAAGQRRAIGFKPIEGIERLRGLRRNALY